MSHKRSLTTGFLVASLGLAAGFAVFSSSDVASADVGNCAFKSKAAEKLTSICKSAGDAKKAKKAISKAMKAAQKKADKSFKCTTCHEDSNGGPLKGDGLATFDKAMYQYIK